MSCVLQADSKKTSFTLECNKLNVLSGQPVCSSDKPLDAILTGQRTPIGRNEGDVEKTVCFPPNVLDFQLTK